MRIENISYFPFANIFVKKTFDFKFIINFTMQKRRINYILRRNNISFIRILYIHFLIGHKKIGYSIILLFFISKKNRYWIHFHGFCCHSYNPIH